MSREMERLTQSIINSQDDRTVKMGDTQTVGFEDEISAEKKRKQDIREEKTMSFEDFEWMRRRSGKGMTVSMADAGSQRRKENAPERGILDDPLSIVLNDPVSVVLNEENNEHAEKNIQNLGRKSGGERLKPTGWLVCVEGPDFGKSYPLKQGRNTIGRSNEMDVAIKCDPAVSRMHHAWIEYREENRHFLAGTGEARKLVYLNEELLILPQNMKKNDVLYLGDSALMLIPCCDADFSWNDLH